MALIPLSLARLQRVLAAIAHAVMIACCCGGLLPSASAAAAEPLVVIVNPASGVERMTGAEVADVFMGAIERSRPE